MTLSRLRLVIYTLTLFFISFPRAWEQSQLHGDDGEFDIWLGHKYSGLEGENYVLADDALSTNVGNLYSFTPGLVPSGRVKHVLVFVDPFVVVFGGYAVGGSFLDDVQMFDTRSRRWSGVVLKRHCCNDHGIVVETSGLQESKGQTSPQAGIKDAFSLPIVKPYKEGSKIGFQGDLPIPRAEHAGAEANGLVYIFGGVTEMYGYSRDFYSFDPVKIEWRWIDKYSGNAPPRRAGHSMTTDYSSAAGGNGKRMYLFGGRSIMGQRLIGLNDVWAFDTNRDEWSCVSCVATASTISTIQSGPSPIGRQHHAAAMANGYLIIYGGIEPASNITFNDIWAFDVGLKVWQQLAANSGQTGGFAPPPLYHANLLSLAKISQSANSTGYINNGFLLYGGVGGGGSCGAHDCGLLETVLGQVYRLKITFGTRVGATARESSNGIPLDMTTETDMQTMYINSNPVWEYARITGQGSGRLMKRYGMESVCFDQKRGVMYEMGGMRPRSNNLATTGIQATLDINGAAYLDAGEEFPEKLWDRHTGEHLRQTNQQPTNGPWTFEDGFTRFQPLLNNSLEFLSVFRAFTVTVVDVVELWTDEAGNSDVKAL